MQDAAIRDGWSNTPQYEAPWFADQLKHGACFALAMAPVAALSGQQLRAQATRPFDRLRRAILPGG